MKRLQFILSFVAGVLLGCFFLPFSYVSNLPLPDPLIAQKEKLFVIDSTRKADSVFYHRQADSLLERIDSQAKKFQHEKNKLRDSRQKEFVYITQLKSDTSLSEHGKLMVDSLQVQIQNTHQVQDSIILHYETQDSLYKNLVAIRDTQLLLCNKSFIDSKALLAEQFLREQKLQEDLKTALKQQKRKINRNRLLAGGMFFVSGIATTLLIKSRQ